MTTGAATRRAYLLAHPAGHSLSPAMHGAAFAALGIAADYTALDVAPTALESVITTFRTAPDFLGANVTVPHKVAVMRFLDEVDATASAIGAVNTIERVDGQGGKLLGRNTDADGFLGALAELRSPPSVGESLVLGAGGSARAVVWALLQQGTAVSVYNRSPDRAAALVAELGGSGRGSVRVVAEHEAGTALATCDLLVNTTSVGMAGGPAPDASPAPAPLTSMKGGAAVMDLVYRPAVTPLLRHAQAAGVANLNGLPMLVYQGASAFNIWTGVGAPVAAMRAAVEAALLGHH